MRNNWEGGRHQFNTQVLPFWKQYGIRPQKMWYDLYCSKDRAYDPYYIPADIYWQKIYPALNQADFRHAYTDKCFYEHLFPSLKQPKTILRNSNHCFYDATGRILSFDQAKSVLKSKKRFVIKPAIYSGEGVDIFFYEREKDPDLDFAGLLVFEKERAIG
ncbi:MAG: hypothetical protein ACOX1U_03665 [Saccharofermentanales bacterium]|jgi:hypothetical protein|nr:hypothetical protein [Clostridiaceae bacterium]